MHVSCVTAVEMDHAPSILDEIPYEGVLFLVAACAARIFFPLLSAPLFGIGLSVTFARLAIKLLSCYDKKLLIDLTKEACKLHRKYPKLQLICFLFSLAIAFISKTLGFLAGAITGSSGALILDVENHILMQQLERRNVTRPSRP